MKKELMDYNDGSAELEAFVAYEEADSPKPLVLVVHDWSGRRDFACKRRSVLREWDMLEWLLICTVRAYSVAMGM